MVEETIQAVKETEQKAEDIIRDAKVKQKEILDQAQLDALHLKEDYLAKAKNQAEQAMDAVQSDCKELRANEQKKMESEVNLLKEMALRKKEEAMDLVIEELI